MLHTRGVTLLELIVTVAIIAILITMAVPSLAEMRQNSARTAAVNDFLHALYLARSEAIKRARIVSICKSTNGIDCANPARNWSQGWLVFANIDQDDPPQ